ncbi:EAP30/Vps36 family-domain-containing protein [Cytidiella melzeri]|nr:EAP30/Vps36 family-domain-containing protein [Cytidiella melzeri]
MDTLRRYTKAVDGTIPVPALLYQEEEILAYQDGVVIFLYYTLSTHDAVDVDRNQKAPQHQSGTVHATSHRLFYVDRAHPSSRSFALDLSHVSRTDYYAGLLRSSPKVTLYLNALSFNASGSALRHVAGKADQTDEPGTWECEVCSYRNTLGLSSAASQICGLCGVARSAASSKPSSSVLPTQLNNISLSSSLPSSSDHLPNLVSSVPPSRSDRALATEVACSACTFLNHRLLPNCEICGTDLPRQPSRHAPAKSAPTSRPPSDDENENDSYEVEPGPRTLKLSFRKGGDKLFYAVLRRSLLGKAWEPSKIVAKLRSSDGAAPGKNRSGINSILHEVSSNATTSQSNLEDALQDLEGLMVKAKEMVRVAEDLNERLSASTAAAAASAPSGAPAPSVVEPEEATFIRSSLAQLGLQMENAPVTQDMIKDERRWAEELARELAGVLEGHGGKGGFGNGGMMKKRGVVGMDEIWGGWNRARGVALIPPSTFLQIIPHLPAYTSPPIHARTFPSGLSVLHTPPFTRAAFSSRLVSLLTLVGPRTTVEVAYEEQLPIGLAQDMIKEVEEAGDVCRDDGGGGVNMLDEMQGGETQWWPNIFKEYVWDGQG